MLNLLRSVLGFNTLLERDFRRMYKVIIVTVVSVIMKIFKVCLPSQKWHYVYMCLLTSRK